MQVILSSGDRLRPSEASSRSKFCNDSGSNSSCWENSTFLRESRTCNLLNRWNISSKGKEKNDPEEFVMRLPVCNVFE